MFKSYFSFVLLGIMIVSGFSQLSAQSTCSASNSIGACTATCNVGKAVCTADQGQTPECKCQGSTFIESMRRLVHRQQSISQEDFAALHQKVVSSKKPIFALEEEIETYWTPLFKKSKITLQSVSKLLREALAGILSNDRDSYNEKMEHFVRQIDKISDGQEKERIEKKLAHDLKEAERSESQSKTMRKSVQANSAIQQDIPNNVQVSGHPNPFSDKITIAYSIPVKSFVKLGVYDLMGNPVKVLVQGNSNPGNYFVEWDGNGNNHTLSNGLYFLRLEANNTIVTQRVVLSR